MPVRRTSSFTFFKPQEIEELLELDDLTPEEVCYYQMGLILGCVCLSQ